MIDCDDIGLKFDAGGLIIILIEKMYDNESCTNVQFSSWDCIIQGSCWPNGKASEYESEDSGWKETCFDHHVAYDFLNA